MPPRRVRPSFGAWLPSRQSRIRRGPRRRLATGCTISASKAIATRTRGRMWSHRPATILLVAVIGTQSLATVTAGFGILMKSLRWELIALAWGYATAWILLLDRLELVAYRWLERAGRSRRG